MDRREYQRKYMRKWRAARWGGPSSWVIGRTAKWLSEMADYAYSKGLAQDGYELDHAAGTVLSFYKDLVQMSDKTPENAKESQETAENAK